VRIVRSVKGLVVALLGVVAALGLAAPGHAQGPAAKAPGVLEGVYNVNIDGQASTTWTISPICVPTVGDLREPLLLPVACRLKVAPFRAAGGEAVMVRGQWQYTIDDATGRTCPDGSKAPQTTIYRFDGYTLVGEMKVLTGADCGQQAAMVVVPMTMSLKEPLPTPVTQYPLICEPGGLRRCF
jgi:hypothetical protein